MSLHDLIDMLKRMEDNYGDIEVDGMECCSGVVGEVQFVTFQDEITGYMPEDKKIVIGF